MLKFWSLPFFYLICSFSLDIYGQFPGVTCSNQRLGPLVGNGTSAPYGTRNGTLSADGNFLAFASESSDLLSNLPQGLTSQVYYFDRAQNSLQMLSINASGIPGNGASDQPYVSRSGMFVVYSTLASNLDPNDTNASNDVYLAIPSAPATIRMSVDAQGNQLSGHHFNPSISDDGGKILFVSTNDHIVPRDNNGVTDAFVKDTTSGAIYRISGNGSSFGNVTNANMPIYHAEISANGQAAIFSTQTNVLGENDLSPDVFYVDLSNLPSIPPPIPVSSQWINRALPAGGAAWASISGDGQRVVFSSGSNLHVQGDISDQRDDLFVWERSDQSIRKISPPLAPTIGFTPTYLPKISFNGRWVTVLSYGYSWDASITREEKDTILYDLETDRFEILSRYYGGTGLEDEATATTTQFAGKPVSDDGKTSIFQTESSRVITNFWSDGNGRTDAFLASCEMPDYPTLCSGDGSSTPCPTQSTGAPGCGCPNSTNPNGAKLEGVGFASLSNDFFKFKISGLPDQAPMCLVASLPNPYLPTVLGYGLKCVNDPYVSGYVVTTPQNGKYEFGYGTSVYPSLGALIGVPNTQVTYQAFYLDIMSTHPNFVPVNSTNAVGVFWKP